MWRVWKARTEWKPAPYFLWDNPVAVKDKVSTGMDPTSLFALSCKASQTLMHRLYVPFGTLWTSVVRLRLPVYTVAAQEDCNRMSTDIISWEVVSSSPVQFLMHKGWSCVFLQTEWLMTSMWRRQYKCSTPSLLFIWLIIENVFVVTREWQSSPSYAM